LLQQKQSPYSFFLNSKNKPTTNKSINIIELAIAMVLPVLITPGSNLNSMVWFPSGIYNPLKM